ncbi:MAG TPA: hypothetical protein DCM23_00485 [Firmicutes bacterium]|jgi:phosphoglycolate phosphatase|nr:hypothetical protein [Bacillota bacterium]
MIKNVIFDLDGTLLDSINDIAKALNDVLVMFNLPTISNMEAISFIGNGTDLLIKRALKGKNLSTSDYQTFKTLYMDRQIKFQLANTKPFQGINELLHSLKQSDVRLFVYSNKPHEFAELLIEACFPHLFSGTLGQIPGAEPKPDVTTFIAFMNEHKIMAFESLFVGDSLVDIVTARNANIPVASVGWGYVSSNLLRAGKPDYLVNHPIELLNIVTSNGRIM